MRYNPLYVMAEAHRIPAPPGWADGHKDLQLDSTRRPGEANDAKKVETKVYNVDGQDSPELDCCWPWYG